MNKRNQGFDRDSSGDSPHPLDEGPFRLHNELYGPGIAEAGRSWLESIAALAQYVRGKYLVVIAVVAALYGITCEFFKYQGNGLSSKSLIGTLSVSAMILAIGLASLFWPEDTNAGEKQNTEKNQDETTEPGPRRKSPPENRRPSARDRLPDSHGGDK